MKESQSDEGGVTEFVLSECHDAPLVVTPNFAAMAYTINCVVCLAFAGTPGFEDVP